MMNAGDQYVSFGRAQIQLTQAENKYLLAEIASNKKDMNEDAFYVADLGDIAAKYQQWKKELPRVEPFYAVKCNSDSVVLALLNKLGVGFDCASKGEIQKVLKMKTSPSRVVYANPCKQASHIKYAASSGINLTTFDNAAELYKIKALHPQTRLLLRLLPPVASKAQCPLGMKYGCQTSQAGQLLQLAMELGLNVVGTSFHVGSGCYDAQAFVQAVEQARDVFNLAAEMGLELTMLDIGGGFPGHANMPLSFKQICYALRPALDAHFPPGCGVRLISEPGRYFVASAFKLAVNVIAYRATARDRLNSNTEKSVLTANDEPHYMYYVNDGVYGSFNCLIYDHAEINPELLIPGSVEDENCLYSSSVWGPTCDGLDCLNDDVLLPKMDIGCWLMYADMGAYTISAGSKFNGMPLPSINYVVNTALWNELKLKSPKKSSCQRTCGNYLGPCSAKWTKCGADVIERGALPAGLLAAYNNNAYPSVVTKDVLSRDMAEC